MTALSMPRPVERFVEVSSSRVVRTAIETAVRHTWVVRIVGRPGVGKSAALLHYGEEFKATYCECTGFAKGIAGLLRTLVAAYGIYTDARHVGELADVLYSRAGSADLEDRTRPLFVDEWQTLEPPAQRELLRLAETCRIPLVLCGNAERLFSTRTHRAALEQIKRRFTVPGLSPEDCDSICIEHNVEGMDARDLVQRIGAALEFSGLNTVLTEALANTGGRGSIQRRHLELALHSLNAWARLETLA